MEGSEIVLAARGGSWRGGACGAELSKANQEGDAAAARGGRRPKQALGGGGGGGGSASRGVSWDEATGLGWYVNSASSGVF